MPNAPRGRRTWAPRNFTVGAAVAALLPGTYNDNPFLLAIYLYTALVNGAPTPAPPSGGHREPPGCRTVSGTA